MKRQLTKILSLKGVIVKSQKIVEQSLILEVEKEQRIACCPQCLQISKRLHQNHYSLIKDLPWGEQQVFLRVNRRQFKCDRCQKPFSEDLDFVGKRKKYTDRSAGEICLKYLDESGFSLWANVTYSWGEKGKQKRIEQPKKKGKRLNICGLLEVGQSFEYGLALKSFKSKSYIKLMNWQAEQAQNRRDQTRKITVIIEDKASIHRSQLTQANYQRWQEKGLYIFFLPSYSSDLNRIENEWQRLKEDELAGRMFETEYERAIALDRSD